MKTEIIPVIHAITEEQVLQNIETCNNCNRQKVFLINHHVSHDELLIYAKRGKLQFPDTWIGINLLGMDINQKLQLELPFIDALWCDETIDAQNSKSRKFKGQLFGGLAFKYQKQPTDIPEACKEAQLYTDVACTSGPGTGKEINTFKLNLIKSNLDNHPLAIASGVSKDNISQYKGIVNYLLVASSITDKNEIISAEKLTELVNLLKI